MIDCYIAWLVSFLHEQLCVCQRQEWTRKINYELIKNHRTHSQHETVGNMSAMLFAMCANKTHRQFFVISVIILTMRKEIWTLNEMNNW